FANQWMRMFAGMDWSQMRRTGEAGLAITRDVVFADELQQRRKEAMFERGRKIFAGEPLEDEGKGQGKALADGLIAGMQEKRQDVWAEANRLAEAAIDGSRVGMDAHSPSRRAFELGGFFGQG